MLFPLLFGSRSSVTRFLPLLPFLFCSLPVSAATSMFSVRVGNLRCEYAENPLGIDIAAPRLSWVLIPAKAGSRGLLQKAYRIQVSSSLDRLDTGAGDLWDTGRIDSPQSTQLHYTGKPLASRQHVWWRAMVWDQEGNASGWSLPATWSMGLLKPSDWTGRWIGVRGGEGANEEFSGAHWIAGKPEGLGTKWFRHSFDISEANPPSYGLLAAEGSGEITVFINGIKVVPYFGKYPHGYAAQNISEMVHGGRNVIAVKVEPDSSAKAVLIAGITLDLADGNVRRIQTDGQWKVSAAELAGWEKPTFDDAPWAGGTVLPLALPDRSGERTRLAARMLRKDFHLNGDPRSATVYITGLGLYELYINGKKVGEDVLAPALTEYDKSVLYMTYDVSRMLHRGNNTIGVLLGNGRFYAPRRNIPVFTRTYGYPEARLQLEIDPVNGKRVAISTDETWRATTNGPIDANNDYDGEEYDARKEQTSWTLPGFSARSWNPAQLMDPPSGIVHAQMMQPIRVMRELKPVKITEPQSGVFVFDMGQNMVGWDRLRVAGPAGTQITLRHAETLRPDGMLYTDNLRSARQMDTYTLKGAGTEVYEPRFTSHGYRYVELRGFPGRPAITAITGRVVYDALNENADLVTSNEVINHIYRNMLWGDRGNYHSIPTDCPQRDERQGWLGDRSAASKGESYLFDVSRFYTQWLQDIEDTMDGQGRINDVAPAYWPFYNDNVVWPASFFLVADMLHCQYGDDVVIQKHYPAMKRWIIHMRSLMKDDLMPVDVYGDWCVPPEALNLIHTEDPAKKTAPEILGTAYFYYLLRLMSQFAVIGGHPSDRQDFDQLASKMKVAFNAKYLNPATNQYDNGTQTSSILPLAFGLAPEDRRREIFEGLIRNIDVQTHGHIGTGLVGGQRLMQTLAEEGRPDVAYDLASQTTYPSWGYMIHQGATTISELWNGDTANPAMNSQNHLMLLGDFSTWLYEDLAGIKPDPEHPGFKHIVVHPRIAENLDFVRASHDSPYGRIATSWHRNGHSFTLRLSIPPNTTATVYVPAANPSSVREGGKPAEKSSGLTFIRTVPGAVVYEIVSGDYVFASTL